MPPLLTIAQAAGLLGLKTAEAARNLLRELGVRPIDLGLGRGRGHRYYQHEILAALEGRRQQPKAPAKRVNKARRLDALSYYTASAKDARAMLTPGRIKQ